jgi:hypothetical protein
MATPVPYTPDALLRRGEAAEELTNAGYPVAPATLATKASRGGGPPFRRFGRVPLYRWGDLLTWAESRLSPPMRSTSEADVEHLLDISTIPTNESQSQYGNGMPAHRPQAAAPSPRVPAR